MAKTPDLEGTDKLTSRTDYGILAMVRHSIRCFVAYGDQNAVRRGLTPQQYQALLGIKAGYAGRETISIGELADHLLIKHHSAVELVGRLEAAKLISRKQDTDDRRVVVISITPAGEHLLQELSHDDLHEMRLAVPIFTALVAMLDRDWLPKRQHELLSRMREMAESVAEGLSHLADSQRLAASTNVVSLAEIPSAVKAAHAAVAVLHMPVRGRARPPDGDAAPSRAPALAAFSMAFSRW